MQNENIIISVRINKYDTARARDNLIALGIGDNINSLSDIIRITLYAGLLAMNKFTLDNITTKPSQESIDFINNRKRQKSNKVKMTEIMNKLNKDKFNE